MAYNFENIFRQGNFTCPFDKNQWVYVAQGEVNSLLPVNKQKALSMGVDVESLAENVHTITLINEGNEYVVYTIGDATLQTTQMLSLK